MTRTRLLGVLGVLLGGALLPACGAKLLSFQGTEPPPPSIDGGVTIAALTDDQANTLCAWLVASYPWGGPSPGFGPLPEVPGYIYGPSAGCLLPGTNPPEQITLVYVPQDDCVLNLRHSACQASVASLEQCVTGFYSSVQSADGCNTVEADCASFEAASACDETVLQGHRIASNAMELCVSGLPIVPNVTCPPSGPLDSGAE